MSISSRWLKVAVFVVLYGVLMGSVIRRGDSIRPYDLMEKRVRQNQYGAVIMDAQGNKINYTRELLMAQKAQWEINSYKFKHTPKNQSDMATTADVRTYYAAFGNYMGKSNIVVSQNGTYPEIFLGGSTRTWGSNDYWYGLRYDDATNKYKHTFVSPYSPDGMSRIEVANIVGDQDKEIIVALKDGHIQIYSQTSKELLEELTTTAYEIEGLSIANIDNDEENELIICTEDHLYVYSRHGILEWDIPGIGGNDVVVGQMDEDSTLEIAVTDGHVIDAATQSVQWTWPYLFGKILATADIDFDSMDELIVAEEWYFVWAYDVDSELPKWSIPIDSDIGAIQVIDIDDDSIQELLVGQGQWGEIQCYDTVNQAIEWSIDNPEHGVSDISTADVDADGATELLWCAGADSSGEDYMYIVNWQAKKLEWRSISLDGPFIGPEIGDLNGDGREELVVVSYESHSGYGSGRILVFNKNNSLPYAISGQVAGGNAWGGTNNLSLYDVDKDGQMEILVAACNLYEGLIEIYDFTSTGNFELKWTNSTQPECSPFYSVKAADIDDDGEIEIIAGAGREDCGDGGVYIYVYDYNTGEEEWHSMQMGNLRDNIIRLEINDMDKDGFDEIIGMIDKGPVYIFDGKSKILEDIIFGEHTALNVIEGKNAPMILLGDINGDISAYRYISGSYTKVKQQNFLSGRIDGISLGPEGTNQFFLGSEGTLTVVIPSGIVWQSSSYGKIFGKHTEVMPSGKWFVSSGSYGIFAFKYTF